MKKLITLGVVLVALIVIFVILGPFYILTEGEQCIVTRFGKIVDTQTEAGLKFKMPVTDNVVKYPKKLLSWDGDAQRIPTKENQFIWVDATARWYISDVKKFYETVSTIETGKGRLNDVIDSTIRTVISENYLSEAVRSSNRINDIKFEEDVSSVDSVEDAETLRSLTKTNTTQEKITIGRNGLSNRILEIASGFTKAYGITLEDIIIRQIRYSDDLTESVYTRMIKEEIRLQKHTAPMVAVSLHSGKVRQKMIERISFPKHTARVRRSRVKLMQKHLESMLKLTERTQNSSLIGDRWNPIRKNLIRSTGS